MLRWRFCIPLGIAFFCTNCALRESGAQRYSLRRITSSDRDSLFTAAEVVLEREGYAIDRSDVRHGVITARSLESVELRRSTDARLSRLGRRDAARRLVRVRVDDEGGRLNLRCSAVLQQQIHTGSWPIAGRFGGEDRIGETAIDRDAGTSAEQNTAWRTLRRDTVTERSLLSAIMEEAGADEIGVDRANNP